MRVCARVCYFAAHPRVQQLNPSAMSVRAQADPSAAALSSALWPVFPLLSLPFWLLLVRLVSLSEVRTHALQANLILPSRVIVFVSFFPEMYVHC